jgi:sulfhydrogenase subunit beta (sulfur reductase)
VNIKSHFLREADFDSFVAEMIKAAVVYAPVARKNHFVFAPVSSPMEVRLDYDVTILPPKKVIFPVHQDLVRFGPGGGETAIHPEPRILFGVHFYDIKAIDMLDLLFRENSEDWNYLAQREHTTIVGSNIQKVSARAFWGTVGKGVQPCGHDAFMTKLPKGYLFEVLTPKGEKLLSCGKFEPATEADMALARKVNEEILDKCPEKLSHGSHEIATKVRASFKSKLWEELSRTCFSCGTCNIVCPTCYCFDVQDHWNLDQVSGCRARTWDGCLLEDFAKVSLGAGGTENFRDARSQRYRHRLLRKAAYLNDKLGGPACVGCGRCSAQCVPDIADPVRIIECFMES